MYVLKQNQPVANSDAFSPGQQRGLHRHHCVDAGYHTVGLGARRTPRRYQCRAATATKGVPGAVPLHRWLRV